MRPISRKDILMIENVNRMLKQVVFRGMEYEEALAVGQTQTWLQGLIQEFKISVQMAEEKAKLQAAISEAKEVKPDAKSKSIDSQVPIPEHNQGTPALQGAQPQDGNSGGGSPGVSGAPSRMGGNEAGLHEGSASGSGGGKPKSGSSSGRGRRAGRSTTSGSGEAVGV